MFARRASSLSSASSRYSEFPQEELLAYLQDEDEEYASPILERDIPKSLLPGRPVDFGYSRAAVESGRVEGPPSDAGLARNTSLPCPAQRSVSAPPAQAVNMRPSLPRRGNTTTSRQDPKTRELDRVDELDESSPLAYHHRGPYEVLGMLDTPPARILPIRSEQVSSSVITIVVFLTTHKAYDWSACEC